MGVIGYWPLFLAAVLVVAGVCLLSVPVGLIVAGAAVVSLWFVLREVPDAAD